MKIPKKLRMFGGDWQVVDSGDYGGSFSFAKYKITIPKKYPNKVKEVLLHEIFEAVMVKHYLRYSGIEDSQEYLFNMNHTQMSNAFEDFVFILQDNKLI